MFLSTSDLCPIAWFLTCLPSAVVYLVVFVIFCIVHNIPDPAHNISHSAHNISDLFYNIPTRKRAFHSIKGVFKYYVSTFWEGGLNQNADTADAGEGGWGSLIKCWHWVLEGWESWGLEQKSKENNTNNHLKYKSSYLDKLHHRETRCLKESSLCWQKACLII